MLSPRSTMRFKSKRPGEGTERVPAANLLSAVLQASRANDPLRVLKDAPMVRVRAHHVASRANDPLRVLKVRRACCTRWPGCASRANDPLRVLKVAVRGQIECTRFRFKSKRPVEGTERQEISQMRKRIRAASRENDPLRVLKVLMARERLR